MRAAPKVLLLGLTLAGCAAPDGPRLGAGERAIIGGAAIDSSVHPSVVALLVGNAICTGTLVDRSWILTAAHCAEGLTADEITIVFGAEDVADGAVDDAYGVTPGAIHIHPGYGQLPTGHDLALLQLDAPITDRAPTPIGRGAAPAAMPVVQIGYGLDGEREEGGTAGVLHQVDGTIVSCAIAGDDDISDELSICFDGRVGRSACFGDSGGPAIATTAGRTEVVGVVSAGTSERCTDGISIYGRVEAELSFLDSLVPVVAPPDGGGAGGGDGEDGEDGGDEEDPTVDDDEPSGVPVAGGCAGAGAPSAAGVLLFGLALGLARRPITRGGATGRRRGRGSR